jgi:hypothetical protein
MAASITSAAGYLRDSLPPSFQQSLASDIVNVTNTANSFLGAAGGAGAAAALAGGADLGNTVDAAFGPGAPDLLGALGIENPLAAQQQPGWTFITAPEDVSWDTANQASRIDIFGTNNPPVVAGSRGMRDLTLSNALVEGFVRNIAVEGKVAALENLMNYGLNTSDGFVSVPVYQVWANEKSYGGPEGYFIIKDVKVKETMRDLKGNSTRAYVDVSFMQVPAYQVNSGRDQASQVTAGGVALTPEQKAQAAAAAKNGTNGATAAAAAGNQANQGVGSQAKPAAGPSSAQPGAAPTGLDAVKPAPANQRIP